MTPSATIQHRDIGLRQTGICLCLILLFGLWLRVHHYHGYDHSDEMEYLQAASDIVSGDFRLPSPGDGGHARLRYTIILPLAAAITVFGPDDRACTVPFVLASLASILVAFWLGRDLCRSRAAGLLAAVILALNNKDVAWATRYYPDAIQSLFFALCVWLPVRSRILGEAVERNAKARLTRGQIWCGILAGVSFALAYNTNIISAIFVPVILVVLLMTHSLRRAWSMAIWMLVGFFAIYLPLTIYYWIVTGDPLFELTAIGYSYKPTGDEMDMGGFMGGRLARGLARFRSDVQTAKFYEVFRILMTDEGFLAVARPGVLCLLLGLVCRKKDDASRWAWRLAVLWLVLLYMAYEFGGTLLPLRKVPRYLHMFMFPMAMVVVTTLRPYLSSRYLPRGFALGLLLSLGYSFFGQILTSPGRACIGFADFGLLDANGVLVYFVIFGILFATRHQAAQALAVGLFCFVLFFWCHRLGTSVYSHTILGRALRSMDLTAPVYTNSWRTRMYLQSLFLHDMGPEGVVTLCKPADVMDAVESGHAYVMYGRAVSQYGYCALPQADSDRLLPEIEAKCEKRFDNGLYRVYQKRAEPDSTPTTAPASP